MATLKAIGPTSVSIPIGKFALIQLFDSAADVSAADRRVDNMLAALREAEAFIAGFEDDDVQDVSTILMQIRAVLS